MKLTEKQRLIIGRIVYESQEWIGWDLVLCLKYQGFGIYYYDSWEQWEIWEKELLL